MISIIVAYDKNRAIGAAGTIPWIGRMKNDMKRVRELSTGNAIIMGRKTYDSIGRPLPNRQNIIISRSSFSIQAATVVSSLDDAYAAVETGREIYIFGGEQIYSLALNSGKIDRIYATEIKCKAENPSAFFPPINKSDWQITANQHFDKDDDNEYDYSFLTYEKVH